MFGSLVLLPRILDLRSSEELVARAIVGSCLVGRARVARSSERLHLVLDLRAVFLGSSELPSLERSGVFFARPRTSWLEREFSVSGRSSDQSFARASVFYISAQQRLKHHFFTSFL